MVRGCLPPKPFHIFGGANEAIFWRDKLLVALRRPTIKGVRTSDVPGSDSESIVAIDKLLDFFFPVGIDVLALNFGWPTELLKVERPLHPSISERSIYVSTLRSY